MMLALKNAHDGERTALILHERSEVVRFAALDDKSRRLAALLRGRGLEAGDRVALLTGNDAHFFVAAWAARRCGLRFVPINRHLTAAEAAYIVDDSDACALIVSAAFSSLGTDVAALAPNVVQRLVLGGEADGFEPLDQVLPTIDPIADEDQRAGVVMPYSAGTTGRPKGILRPLPNQPFEAPLPIERLMVGRYAFGAESVYLSPAPLYHAAPCAWSIGTQALGGTVVLLERFDPQAALAAIEQHRVTHAQFVPTHLIRMLRLPAEVRARYDVSSLKVLVHAAAPCPADVKRAIIDWFGPVIYEYYGGSEGVGIVTIDTPQWLDRPGSVGKPADGRIHILDDKGKALSNGEVGTIYFESPTMGSGAGYHKQPGSAAQIYNDQGWGTLGDLGWVDDDGYLFLSDRRSNLIISGGVNIYPREIEDALALHPDVADVAVIGVPNEEFGEEVKAIVIPLRHDRDLAELEADIRAHLAERIARFKLPRSFAFVESLPRQPNGKLIKTDLILRYGPPATRPDR